MKKLITIVAGTRPNFMKVSPLIRSLKKYSRTIKFRLVNTLQHKQYSMNKVFFDDLNIPKPDKILKIIPSTNVSNIANIMIAFENDCKKFNPHLVVVVGDVDSTLACSLVARKLNVPIAHVEAGLRSHDLTMPEEINRILTDRISKFCFATEEDAVRQLQFEGKNKNSIFLSGDVMVDNLFYQLKKIKNVRLESDLLKKNIESYAILTLHRPSNVDNKNNLNKILKTVNELSKKITIFFPVHPRTKNKLKKIKIKFHKNFKFIKPLAYNNFLGLLKDSKIVLTDSGGLQVETSALGIPCITLRENTERPLTLEKGTNNLSGLDKKKIKKIFNEKINTQKIKCNLRVWDGNSADRIVKKINELI